MKLNMKSRYLITPIPHPILVDYWSSSWAVTISHCCEDAAVSLDETVRDENRLAATRRDQPTVRLRMNSIQAASRAAPARPRATTADDSRVADGIRGKPTRG
ncbi:hypothetical protein X777_01192 [Ooceraea biroi]|uniref:Uncharacterized protein n=1 Tax=Ooceraea biroi TaxID=2015173 RepID=A0A026WQE1_OOCBI|nr:hypothetical protein X777_01192 [Ooceraea biroi]